MRKHRALSIDDSELKLMFIANFAEELQIDILNFTDPIRALESAMIEEYDIIFLDYMMPVLNGIDFIKLYRQKNKQTPVVMITAESDDPYLKINALQAGVSDFLSFPFDASEFTVRVSNLLNMRMLQKRLEKKSKLLEVEVLKATKRIIDREQETLMVLAKATEHKDNDTEMHTERVAKYSKLLSKKIGFDEKEQEIIYYSAPLHDIGKIGIPDHVLLKVGKFTKDEYEIMKKHTLIGYKILENTKSEFLAAGKLIALSHHERFDGTGYPYGKKGEEIPISARIVSIADVFDALLSERPYKKAWKFDEAVAYLIEEKEKQFDGNLVEVFTNNIEDVKKIYLENNKLEKIN